MIVNELRILPDSKDKIFVGDFSTMNEDSVSNDFAATQWQEVLSETQNVYQLFAVFFSKCSEIVNKHFPTRKLNLTSNPG